MKKIILSLILISGFLLGNYVIQLPKPKKEVLPKVNRPKNLNTKPKYVNNKLIPHLPLRKNYNLNHNNHNLNHNNINSEVENLFNMFNNYKFKSSTHNFQNFTQFEQVQLIHGYNTHGIINKMIPITLSNFKKIKFPITNGIISKINHNVVYYFIPSLNFKSLELIIYLNNNNIQKNKNMINSLKKQFNVNENFIKNSFIKILKRIHHKSLSKNNLKKQPPKKNHHKSFPKNNLNKISPTIPIAKIKNLDFKSSQKLDFNISSPIILKNNKINIDSDYQAILNKEKLSYIRKKNLKIKQLELELLALQQRINKFGILNNKLLSEVETSSRQVEIVNKVLNQEIDLNDLKRVIDDKDIKAKPLNNVVQTAMKNIQKKQFDLFNLVNKKKEKIKMIKKQLKLIKQKNQKEKKSNYHILKKLNFNKSKKLNFNKVKKINQKRNLNKSKEINFNKIKKINQKRNLNKNKLLIKKTYKWTHLHFIPKKKEKISFLSLNTSFKVKKYNNKYYKIFEKLLIKKDKVKNNVVKSNNNNNNIYVYNKKLNKIAIIFNHTPIKVKKYNNKYLQITNPIYIFYKNLK